MLKLFKRFYYKNEWIAVWSTSSKFGYTNYYAEVQYNPRKHKFRVSRSDKSDYSDAYTKALSMKAELSRALVNNSRQDVIDAIVDKAEEENNNRRLKGGVQSTAPEYEVKIRCVEPPRITDEEEEYYIREDVKNMTMKELLFQEGEAIKVENYELAIIIREEINKRKHNE